MSKGKLAKFADMETYKNVFQYPYSVVSDVPFTMRGHWHEQYFKNTSPIVLELGCGKGEYTVGLARRHPDRNFIGVDIKGARMWTGATMALQEELPNVAFLRTNIEIIDRFFAPGEVSEIWLTFSDPQMKNPRKRLTSTYFLERYRRFLVDNGLIHLKTDSNFLFTYTSLLVEKNHLPVEATTTDLYASTTSLYTDCSVCSDRIAAPTAPTPPGPLPLAASIQTYYEQMWLNRGISIKYMLFRLPTDAHLEEPDVEIPLDDYRSYHRTKRTPRETAK
jgi:tRNA (guanine-N7-)-methyltransferase